ncbi:MAG: triacylglycerol lipase [Pseudomonadota bacterium]
MRHAVYLVPGFFGFEHLGGVYYFRHVEALLERLFEAAGDDVDVFTVSTRPTASIRKRARILADAIAGTRPERFDRLHVVGHSTGGLDARLLVTPGVSLGGEADPIGQRINTVVTLATPNHGTPIAGFFTSLAGKHLLLGMSLFLITSMRSVGGLSYAWLGKGLSLLTRLDDVLGLDNTVLDYFVEHLLKDLDEDRRREIISFMHDVANDQGAMLQLTVEGMDIFNAAAVDAEACRYLSYLTVAPRLSPRIVLEGLRDPYFPASYSLFQGMHRIAGRVSDAYPFPVLSPALQDLARSHLGQEPGPRDNDGVVPLFSQPWGKVCGVVRADHLDVCGHFRPRGVVRHHTDWLRSGAGFTEEAFDALWQDIATRLMGRRPRPSTVGNFLTA